MIKNLDIKNVESQELDRMTYEKATSLYKIVSIFGAPLYFAYSALFYYAGNSINSVISAVFAFICIIFYFNEKEMMKFVVFEIHFQVSVLVYMAVTSLGWAYGVQHLIFVTVAFSFLSTYKNRYVVIIYPIVEIVLYSYLYYTYGNVQPAFALPSDTMVYMYIFNAISAGVLIMFLGHKSEMVGINTHLALQYDTNKFKEMADHDALTGMINRRPMMGLIDKAWDKYSSEGGVVFRVLK